MVDGQSVEGAIVATVSYFDIFCCAPSAREIHRFLIKRRISRPDLERILHESRPLHEMLGHRDGFWFLRGKDHLVPRRVRFLEHSRRFWPEARKMARTIQRTGLASAGFVTGSLAADNADEHADIDFLLTYPPERTWTSWALIRLLAKLPGTGLGQLCPNYALPDDQLEVRPQNLFTAWEIAKAVPLFGFDVYERFVHANAWVDRYLPNALPGIAGPHPSASEAHDTRLIRTLTKRDLFQRLERAERRRKRTRDVEDVGVDMSRREREGSHDRHAPTRSFQTLSELRYRLELLGLESHPIFEELKETTSLLSDEMRHWGEAPIEGPHGAPKLRRRAETRA